MRNKTCLAFAMLWIVVGFASLTISFGQTYWKKTYNESETCQLSQILPTSDSNYLIAGLTSIYGAGNYDIWIQKIKSNGEIMWTKTFGGKEADFFSSMVPTADGNYLIAGTTSSFGAGSYDMWLIKINPNGDTLWTRTYGDKNNDQGTSILATTDGNYLLRGIKYYSATAPGRDSNDIIDVKIRSNGDTLGTTIGRYGQPLADGNFLNIRKYQSDWEAETKYWLEKTDAHGDTLWTKSLGTSYSNLTPSMVSTPDGNYLLSGSTDCFGADSNGVWFIKINPDGTILWSKTLGMMGNQFTRGILPTNDSSFFLIGWGYIDGNSIDWLVKINQKGEAIWTKIFNYPSDGNHAVYPITEGNFLMTGYWEGSDSTAWLRKYNAQGEMLWMKTIGKNRGRVGPIVSCLDGNFLLYGDFIGTSSQPYSSWIFCIIADQYAVKGSRFAYKIPIYGIDTMSFVYTALKIPAGMTVSPGGTISWIPQTDSSYLENVEYIVANKSGTKDTLSFILFVNYNPSSPTKPSRITKNASKPFEIITTLSSIKIKFSLPSLVTSICIYDINGRIIDRITPEVSSSGASAVWPGNGSDVGKIPTGKYFAKVSDRNKSSVKSFIIVR
jgi:hypothetical protein